MKFFRNEHNIYSLEMMKFSNLLHNLTNISLIWIWQNQTLNTIIRETTKHVVIEKYLTNISLIWIWQNQTLNTIMRETTKHVVIEKYLTNIRLIWI